MSEIKSEAACCCGHNHDHEHDHAAPHEHHHHEHGHSHHHEFVAGEKGTRLVLILTMATMIAEIAAGWAFGSMALLADGWHMAGHAGAMAVAVFAYAYARRHANNPDFVFGVGKVNALAGFANAVSLVLVAAYMAAESLWRLVHPVDIAYVQALAVAVVGLLVNLGSAWLLRDDHSHTHGHDHNLKAAYFHVLADAMTSVLAIGALLGGRYWGLNGLDPIMGVVGAVVIGKWAFGLARETASVLLDRRLDRGVENMLRQRIESGSGARVTQVKVWSLGGGELGCDLDIEDGRPQLPDFYRGLLEGVEGLRYVRVEVCPTGQAVAK